MKRTTVGRFWGYVGILIALSVSLAGNVKAAYLHVDPITGEPIDPSWVDIGFAGIPPLVAFLSIEIVNHNPWEGTPWGPRVKSVLLGVVTPASAVVSFIHLVSVVVVGRVHDFSPEGVITWTTAVLTALLIDGLMFGGTAALLLPKMQRAPKAEPVAAIDAYPNWREEIQRALADLKPVETPAVVPVPEPPVEKPIPARRGTAQRTTGKRRYAIRDNPLWKPWVTAREDGNPWSASMMAEQVRDSTGKALTVDAAASMVRRWERELAKSQQLELIP